MSFKYVSNAYVLWQWVLKLYVFFILTENDCEAELLLCHVQTLLCDLQNVLGMFFIIPEMLAVDITP